VRFSPTHHLTLHLDECRPGQGVINFGVLLTEINKLSADTTLILEHQAQPQDYAIAVQYIRDVACQNHVVIP